MPLYDFVCQACATRFEELQGSEAAGPACPSCGSSPTQRLVTSFARPRPRGTRDGSWTPAATRTDAIGAAHHHH